jgi:ribosome recycling factor
MAQPAPFNAQDIKRRMSGAVEALKHDFGGLRTGRASAALLEPIVVEAYGANMPLNQVASVTVPEARMLQISVWDRGLVIATEKAIRASNLGLNPMTEGQVIRLRMPELTQDRRKELVKVAHQYAEKARVAARNVRRDGMDQLKALEKAHLMSEDDHKGKADEVQKMTDDTIKDIDASLKAKEAEIMQV